MNKLPLNIKLPEQIQKCSCEETKLNFEENLLDIIEDTFIHSADEDYVAARMFILHKMTRAFYWAAGQTIEKYFKAILLQQGFSVKKCGHSFSKMINEHNNRFEFLYEIDTQPHDDFPDNVRSLWPFKSIIELVKHIEDNGSTDSRYNQVSLSYVISVLILFDRLISKIQSQIVRTDTIAEYIQSVNPALEKYLIEQNDCYGNFKLSGQGVHRAITTLEMVLSGRFGHQSLYEKWLETNMKINLNLLKK
ncbi:MAG: hypothetical protein AB7D03_10305 [Thiomicrospira sp.]